MIRIFSFCFILLSQVLVAQEAPEILLIRLQSKERNVDALLEQGREQDAQELQASQQATNEDILRSFRKNYNFSPVYFFYAQDSEDIQSGDWSSVLFDAELNPHSEEAVSNFIVGEFGSTPEMGIDGLLLRDSQFKLLESPFPSVIRQYRLLGLIERSKPDMVAELNTMLHNIYPQNK